VGNIRSHLSITLYARSLSLRTQDPALSTPIPRPCDEGAFSSSGNSPREPNRSGSLTNEVNAPGLHRHGPAQTSTDGTGARPTAQCLLPTTHPSFCAQPQWLFDKRNQRSGAATSPPRGNTPTDRHGPTRTSTDGARALPHYPLPHYPLPHCPLPTAHYPTTHFPTQNPPPPAVRTSCVRPLRGGISL
jgi:hypothetical protein